MTETNEDKDMTMDLTREVIEQSLVVDSIEVSRMAGKISWGREFTLLIFDLSDKGG